MYRYIMPIIFIAVSITLFFTFTSTIYGKISDLKIVITSYNQALDNSKALENERDKLTAKYNSITPENLTKLERLLPNNIDNIRLILEIEQMALPYGMVLKNVKYNTDLASEAAKASQAAAQLQAGGTIVRQTQGEYGDWDLEFSTSATYNNFLNFTKDLESNLRIVDIASIGFSSDLGSASSSEVYQYNFKIKTYWLKN